MSRYQDKKALKATLSHQGPRSFIEVNFAKLLGDDYNYREDAAERFARKYIDSIAAKMGISRDSLFTISDVDTDPHSHVLKKEIEDVGGFIDDERVRRRRAGLEDVFEDACVGALAEFKEPTRKADSHSGRAEASKNGVRSRK